MAWWFVLRDASEPDIVAARQTLERVTDEMLPAMVAGRIRFDAELARQAAFDGQ